MQDSISSCRTCWRCLCLCQRADARHSRLGCAQCSTWPSSRNQRPAAPNMRRRRVLRACYRTLRRIQARVERLAALAPAQHGTSSLRGDPHPPPSGDDLESRAVHSGLLWAQQRANTMGTALRRVECVGGWGMPSACKGTKKPHEARSIRGASMMVVSLG